MYVEARDVYKIDAILRASADIDGSDKVHAAILKLPVESFNESLKTPASKQPLNHSSSNPATPVTFFGKPSKHQSLPISQQSEPVKTGSVNVGQQIPSSGFISSLQSLDRTLAVLPRPVSARVNLQPQSQSTVLPQKRRRGRISKYALKD